MLRLGGALRRDPRAHGAPLGRALRAGLSSRPEAPVPLVVALDMDECLIHCTGFSQPSGVPARVGGGGHTAEGDGIEKLHLRLASGVTCSVLKRQGLDAFLSQCCDMFETYVFTAGVEEYASAVLDAIDTERKLAGRLYRQHCRAVKTPVGDQFLKDLSAVAGRCQRKDVERIVLVDNNPLSFVLQQRHPGA
ncbi:unnamed protein product [Prorocentrum cordatum]|uniref:Mitochondrial import inner membrane translocase subunit TIM50 n=1 Tax=Prorocentrum cordatum TaxID=2364126 RepID=A0ABN9QKC6_9DINO|nr:unnamed protein product [Polarella glacialis]